jgi:hypothetical protein
LGQARSEDRIRHVGPFPESATIEFGARNLLRVNSDRHGFGAAWVEVDGRLLTPGLSDKLEPQKVSVGIVLEARKAPQLDITSQIVMGDDTESDDRIRNQILVFHGTLQRRNSHRLAVPDIVKLQIEPGHVFLSPRGKRWDERNFARAFDRLRTKTHKAKKVRPLSFHCARHTFASWALEGGRSIVWVQNRLGHSSPEITLRTYSHFIPGSEDELDFLAKPLKIVRVTEA